MFTRAAGTLGLILVSGCWSLSTAHGQPQTWESVKLGEAAPDFALANIEGKRVQLQGYRSKKKVLLVFYPALFRAGG
jgi:hypothetical protein